MAASPSPSPARKSVKKPCECSKFEILVNVRENGIDGDLIWDEEIRTGCPGVKTGRTFAPGHDAKLKGFLIRAGIAGHEVTKVDGGVAISGNPIGFAEEYGFGQMVRSGIAGGLVKAETRKLKKGQRSEVAEAAQAKVDALTHDGNASRKARELAALVAAEEAKHAAETRAARQAQQDQADAEWADAHTDEDKARYADPSEPQIVKAKVGRWEYEGTVEDGQFLYTDSKGEARSAAKFTRV